MLLIFKSSRIVVTGAREYDDVVDGFHKVYDIISKLFVYKKSVESLKYIKNTL